MVDLPTARRLEAAEDTLSAAVAATLSELELVESDAAIVRLAQQYAATIDGAMDRYGALETFGPKLRSALQSLGATPAQRAKVTKRDDKPASALGRIRSAR